MLRHSEVSCRYFSDERTFHLDVSSCMMGSEDFFRSTGRMTCGVVTLSARNGSLRVRIRPKRGGEQHEAKSDHRCRSRH